MSRDQHFQVTGLRELAKPGSMAIEGDSLMFSRTGHHTCCCLLFFTLDAGLLASSQYPEGPATGHLDTVFLGFPVSISKRSDGSQHSKLPLHASHVALQT